MTDRATTALPGGIGRTGTVIGCLLRDGGLNAKDAIDLTRATRRGTIETGDQERFVKTWRGLMELRYGHELKDWQAAKDEIVEVLGARIRAGKGPITYGELCSTMKTIVIEPHSYALAHMLGEVSDDEDSAGRGMLSAYVVSAETGGPGGGFFELAAQLGRKFDDRDAFWVAELKRVEAAWTKELK